MEIYFAKSSLLLIVLYGLYKIMLQYEFNHQINRFVALIYVFSAASISLFQFQDLHQLNHLQGSFYVVAKETADLSEHVSSAISGNNSNIVLLIYITGVITLLSRTVIGLASVLWLYFRSPKSHQWGFTVVSLSRDLSPFTFFNILFLGHNCIDESEMETMVLHEKVHRDQYHSIDAVVLEVMTAIFWFNPVIWFFQRDIRAEHEYLADEQVLANGISATDYQLILFKARTGISIEIGNNLSNSTRLNKRFKMMTNAGSRSKASYLRAALFLTLSAAVLFLGASSVRRQQIPVDKVATYAQGEEAMYRTITKVIAYPADARSDNRAGLVNVSFIVNENGEIGNVEAETGNDGYLLHEIVVVAFSNSSQKEKGINNNLKAEAVRAVASLGKFTPAEREGKAVKSVLIFPIKFKLESK